MSPDICNEMRPGMDCTPLKHHSECRYAGSEPKVMVFSQRQWRLLEVLRAGSPEAGT